MLLTKIAGKFDYSIYFVIVNWCRSVLTTLCIVSLNAVKHERALEIKKCILSQVELGPFPTNQKYVCNYLKLFFERITDRIIDDCADWDASERRLVWPYIQAGRDYYFQCNKNHNLNNNKNGLE